MLQLTPDKSENKIIKNVHDNNNIIQQTMGFKSFLACSCDNNNNNEKSESGDEKKHCLKNYIKNEQDFSDENKMEIYHMLHSLPNINNIKLKYFENKEVSFFSYNQFKNSGLNNVPAKIIYDNNESNVAIEYQLSVDCSNIAIAIQNCLEPLLEKMIMLYAFHDNVDDDDNNNKNINHNNNGDDEDGDDVDGDYLDGDDEKKKEKINKSNTTVTTYNINNLNDLENKISILKEIFESNKGKGNNRIVFELE
jgi:hypothetical protein